MSPRGRASETEAALGVGERTLLRRPTARDCGAYVALRRASAAFHRPWEPDPPAGMDPHSTRAFERYLAGAQSEHRERLLLFRRQDEALLGAFNFSEIVRGPLQSAYLGYWVGEPYARQGYMSEGLCLALAHAFGALGLHRIEANVRPENRASIALLRRARFRQEGFSPRYLRIAGDWRDHERWAILAEDFATPPDAAGSAPPTPQIAEVVVDTATRQLGDDRR